jgi:hypothetical protein
VWRGSEGTAAAVGSGWAVGGARGAGCGRTTQMEESEDDEDDESGGGRWS